MRLDPSLRASELIGFAMLLLAVTLPFVLRWRASPPGRQIVAGH